MDQSRDQHVVALGQATIESDDRMQAPHLVVGTKESLEVLHRVWHCLESELDEIRQRTGLARGLR